MDVIYANNEDGTITKYQVQSKVINVVDLQRDIDIVQAKIDKATIEHNLYLADLQRIKLEKETFLNSLVENVSNN